MKRRRLGLALLRLAVYLYCAAGLSLLVSAALFAAWRVAAPSIAFPPAAAAILFVLAVFVLAAGSREDFGRPLGARTWVLLGALATAGLVPAALAFLSRPS